MSSTDKTNTAYSKSCFTLGVCADNRVKDACKQTEHNGQIFDFFDVVCQNPFVPLQGTLLYPQEPRCRRAHEKPQWHRQIRTALPEQLK